MISQHSTELERAALRAGQQVKAALKARDSAVAAVVLERLGITVPQLFEYADPATGNKYSVNVTARLALVERGVPGWATDEDTHLAGDDE